MAPVKKREIWSSKLDFILTCVGYSVGLSNVWRFPYLCFKHGGGAFLIPYLITFVLCGLPILCLEFIMGQYTGEGFLIMWRIAPLFTGIGVGWFIVNVVITLYYIFVLALALRYLFSSFTTHVPWTSCGNEWNSQNCLPSFRQNTSAIYTGNFTTNNSHQAEITDTLYNNNTLIVQENASLPTEEYFLNHILKLSPGIDTLGSLNWPLVLCLTIAWLVVFLATVKGIKSSGKVVYFTALFPYVMLTCLVIRGITLPGSLQGIKYYLIPRWEKLASSEVWFSAAVQLFYSTGVAQGCPVTLASYNKFHNNCVRDTFIVIVINCATSVFAGFAVFSILGYLSVQMGKPIDEVVQSGPGLAFIVYPQALAAMPATPFWSALFFFMLLLLGIDSEIVHFETVVSCIQDKFPSLRTTKRRVLLTALVASLMFVVGLIFTTEGGFYIFVLVDWYSCSFCLFIIAVLECIAFGWVYGTNKVSSNLKEMIGLSANWYFKLCWKFFAPIFVLVILGFTTATWTPVTFGSYEYPPIFRTLGWLLAAASVIPIPLTAVYILAVSNQTTFITKLKNSLVPTKEFSNLMQRRMNNDNTEEGQGNELLEKVITDKS